MCKWKRERGKIFRKPLLYTGDKEMKQPKKKPKKKKQPAEEKNYAKIKPTQDYWFREGYVKRRTNWMWRLAPWLRAKCEQCKSCQMGHRCNRIPCDEQITAKVAKGEECPDYKSVWKKIMGGDEEPYDWGF